MVLFRIINLNVSGVFVYLSYSPLLIIYIIMCIFFLFTITLGSFAFNINTIILLIILILFAVYFLFAEIIIDNLYGLSDVVTFYRVAQYCFIWFILSEAALFLSFFWAAFALNILTSLEFHATNSILPLMYSINMVNYGFIFYWSYLDLFNIILNTFLLFFSGVFCNLFYILMTYKSLYCSIFFCILSIISGFLFIWNQLWEFSLLTFTISTNSFCSVLLSIDLLHFSHVSLGVLLLVVSLVKLINVNFSSYKTLFITCTILYWHFVDFVWFLLLRFLYFNILCTFIY